MKKTVFLITLFLLYVFISCSREVMELVVNSNGDSDTIEITENDWKRLNNKKVLEISALNGEGKLKVLKGKRIYGWLNFDSEKTNLSILLIQSSETQKLKLVRKIGDETYNLIPYPVINSLSNGVAFTFSLKSQVKNR